jgi:hypothetical protein
MLPDAPRARFTRFPPHVDCLHDVLHWFTVARRPSFGQHNWEMAPSKYYPRTRKIGDVTDSGQISRDYKVSDTLVNLHMFWLWMYQILYRKPFPLSINAVKYKIREWRNPTFQAGTVKKSFCSRFTPTKICGRGGKRGGTLGTALQTKSCRSKPLTCPQLSWNMWPVLGSLSVPVKKVSSSNHFCPLILQMFFISQSVHNQI